MAVSFTSGSCQKQPQDATALKELDQETLSASFNLGCSESSPSRCPSDPDSSPQARSWDFPEAARALHQPAPALGSYRNSRHAETVGYSLPGRNGQGKDLMKGCTRTTPSPEDKGEEPESREAEGNQVSALVTVWQRRRESGAGPGPGWGAGLSSQTSLTKHTWKRAVRVSTSTPSGHLLWLTLPGLFLGPFCYVIGHVQGVIMKNVSTLPAHNSSLYKVHHLSHLFSFLFKELYFSPWNLEITF